MIDLLFALILIVPLLLLYALANNPWRKYTLSDEQFEEHQNLLGDPNALHCCSTKKVCCHGKGRKKGARRLEKVRKASSKRKKRT